MKHVLIGAAMVAMGSLAVIPAAEARPGGCLKYGAAGALAGKLAGGHTWKGAAAGCALGYFRRSRHDREMVRGRGGYDGRGYARRGSYDETGSVGRGYSRY
ncbi:MAG: hypothetical protein JWQ36_3493 [Enterovirga sp.]|jgi:hypothetical protein|nr:hypothetical protein [Enterovirga sp.]